MFVRLFLLNEVEANLFRSRMDTWVKVNSGYLPNIYDKVRDRNSNCGKNILR